MKNASPGFIAALGDESLSLCRLWTVNQSSAAVADCTLPFQAPSEAAQSGLAAEFEELGVFRYTDLSSDVWYQGKRYRSDPGITISAIRNSVDGGFQTATVTLPLNPDGITELGVRSGDYDAATFAIELLHYDRPELGTMTLFSGTIEQAQTTDRGRADFDVKGTTSGAGAGSLTEVYTERCRNRFGDTRCKVDTVPLRVAFTVDNAGAAPARFGTSAAQAKPAAYWDLGTVRWLTGANAGRVQAVVTTSGDQVLLSDVPGHDIQVGDTGLLVPGCTLYRSMCRDRWSNLLNYRGEPDTPVIQAAPTPPDDVPPPSPVAPTLSGARLPARFYA